LFSISDLEIKYYIATIIAEKFKINKMKAKNFCTYLFLLYIFASVCYNGSRKLLIKEHL